MLMNGPAEFSLLSPADLGEVARGVARRFNLPAALHLDHGESLDHVRACFAAGYTSVMLDYSSPNIRGKRGRASGSHSAGPPPRRNRGRRDRPCGQGRRLGHRRRRNFDAH